MAKTENLTILFTDIVGYTQLTSTISREALRRLLREHDRLLLRICRAFGGRRVKSIGDALLMTFHSPTDAVRSAMAMQNALERARREQPDLEPLHIRCAVNVGEVRSEFRDVFGEAVNLASRLQALTPGDGIWFTEAVYLAMNKAEVPSELVGTRKIRGMPEPVRIFCVPSHRAHRLVPAEEGLKDASFDLPYQDIPVPVRTFDVALDSVRRKLAGAGTRMAPVWRTVSAAAAHVSAPVRWAVVTGVCIAVVLSLTLYVPVDSVDASLAPPSRDFGPLVQQGEELLARKDYEALERLVDERLQRDPRDAAAMLLRAHLAFARKRPLNAAADYSSALAEAPELGNDPVLVKNLLGLLEREPAVVKTIMLQHPSEPLLQALGQRSGQPGFAGRNQAAKLLRDVGRAELIDRFGYAVQELEGRTECGDRLAAIRELRALKDPRAIPHVEKALKGGMAAWFRQRCLRDEAEATLAELRRRK